MESVHNIMTDDMQAVSAHELNVFDARSDTSGSDSLGTVARMIHDDSLEISRKRVPREAHLVGNKGVWLAATIPALHSGPYTILAIGSFRRTRDEDRVTEQAPVNPIRFSCESKRIQLRSCRSSCSTVVFPFDIAKTCGCGGYARWIFQKRIERTRWHTDC